MPGGAPISLGAAPAAAEAPAEPEGIDGDGEVGRSAIGRWADDVQASVGGMTDSG